MENLVFSSVATKLRSYMAWLQRLAASRILSASHGMFFANNTMRA